MLAVAVVVELLAGLLAAGSLSRGIREPGPPARATAAAPARSPQAERATAVRALLGARATAVRRHDRKAFLATIDARSVAFRARQARMFDALRSVPLKTWEYVLDEDVEQPSDQDLNRKYLATWWAPAVALRYTFDGWESAPTFEPQHVTFVRRADERWYLASDDDFARKGDVTTRALWDGGPVVVVRGRRTLALGHPGARPAMVRLAAEVDAAVPRVTAVWGRWSRKVVLLVPSDQRELGRLIGSSKDLSSIAAVALSQITEQDSGGYRPVGDRVLVNPRAFAQLGEVGRRVVLTHEVTHIASRADTGPVTPTWLAEGLADYVGYLQVDLPLSVIAPDVQRDVRAGRLPRTLPTDKAFAADSRTLSQAYEQAWLAFRLLVQRYGLDRVLAFYRQVGQARDGSSTKAVDVALRDLGTDVDGFTATWRASLRAQLS